MTLNVIMIWFFVTGDMFIPVLAYRPVDRGRHQPVPRGSQTNWYQDLHHGDPGVPGTGQIFQTWTSLSMSLLYNLTCILFKKF